MAYFSNLPLGACISLATANDLVRRRVNIEQPELFLEKHSRLAPRGYLPLDSGTEMLFLTMYSTVDPIRNKIDVRTLVEREQPRWAADVPVTISASVEVIRDGKRYDYIGDERYRVIWTRTGNPLGLEVHWPKLVYEPHFLNQTQRSA